MLVAGTNPATFLAMRAEVVASEDTTTLYLRWEIVFEPGDRERLERLPGPVSLRIPARHYVDVDGQAHEALAVEVPVFPHNGSRNRGQARFTDHEARRAFWEALERAVVSDVTPWLYEVDPATVPYEGHVFEVGAGDVASA